MSPGMVLVEYALAVLVFAMVIGLLSWTIKQIFRPWPWIVVLGGLWLVWEMVPGSHVLILHLWSDAQTQGGQALVWLREITHALPR